MKDGEILSLLRSIEQKLKSKTESRIPAHWLKADAFMRQTGLTSEQLRGLRKKYCLPGDRMVRPHPRGSGQYQYNLTEYWQVNGKPITHEQLTAASTRLPEAIRPGGIQ
jgi:hypothetical protein